MATLSELASQRRPAVRILCHGCDEGELQPILWGLEEEGIPYEVQSVESGETQALAKQAAHMSTLNVGICAHGGSKVVVLHHRDLAEESPLFTLPLGGANASRLRVLGANAARLVKCEPLILDDPITDGEARYGYDEALTDAVVRTVLELLSKG